MEVDNHRPASKIGAPAEAECQNDAVILGSLVQDQIKDGRMPDRPPGYP